MMMRMLHLTTEYEKYLWQEVNLFLQYRRIFFDGFLNNNCQFFSRYFHRNLVVINDGFNYFHSHYTVFPDGTNFVM